MELRINGEDCEIVHVARGGVVNEYGRQDLVARFASGAAIVFEDEADALRLARVILTRLGCTEWRAAVEEHNEAYARAADLYYGPTDSLCLRIAADIRALRGVPNEWRSERAER